MSYLTVLMVSFGISESEEILRGMNSEHTIGKSPFSIWKVFIIFSVLHILIKHLAFILS